MNNKFLLADVVDLKVAAAATMVVSTMGVAATAAATMGATMVVELTTTGFGGLLF